MLAHSGLAPLRVLPGTSRRTKGAAMRKIDCDCGHTIEADNDAELFEKGKQHVAEVHPDLDMSDEQLRQLITARAYDG
jgi:predicted small metal-binding protein